MPWWAHQWTEHSGGKTQWAWSYFSRNFQSWNVKEKRTETQDRIFKNCGTPYRMYNICIMGILEERKEQKKYLNHNYWEISKIKTDIKPQVQKAQRTPRRIYSGKCTHTHTHTALWIISFSKCIILKQTEIFALKEVQRKKD